MYWPRGCASCPRRLPARNLTARFHESSRSDLSRGSGHLQPGWDDKSPETVRVKKPLHRRRWARRLLRLIACVAIVAAIGAFLLIRQWHREQLEEPARQRRSIEAFTGSAEFSAFAQTADAHLLAPHAQAFVRRLPENTFPALRLDPSLQDATLAAFAARSGPDTSIADVEHLFALYAAIGPAMWRTIERSSHASAPFAAPPAE